MADTKSETGWTKGWPENGNYWRRRVDGTGEVVLARVHGDTYRLMDGCSGFRNELYEWLGPITPPTPNNWRRYGKRQRLALKAIGAPVAHLLAQEALATLRNALEGY